MPIDVQMPDGTIISGVPDNITQADLMARYKAFTPPVNPTGAVPDELGRYDAAKQPTQLPPDAGFSVKDTALALGQGVVGAGKSLTDVFGAENAASQALGDVSKSLAEQYSPERKAEMARREVLQKQASKGTVSDEIGAFLAGVAEAPVQSLAQGLGSIAPYIGTGIIGGIAKLGGATVKAINTVVGAAQGTGAIKGSLYDGVKQELEKSGMSEKEAADKASKAQEYLGENFLDIVGGAILGAAGARVGVESMLTPGAAAKLDARLLSRMGKAALAEAPLEGAQGGQEQLAINRALQNQGIDVGTFEGVAGAAARDAAVGALTGAAVGVRGPGAPAVKPPVVPPVTPPEEKTTTAVPPRTAPTSESQNTQAMVDEFNNKPIAEQITTPEVVETAKTPPVGNVWEGIQNRDRSTPASIAQMTKIANEPDYSRVSMSRDYGTGAPIVAGSEIDPTRLGRTDTVTGADGNKVQIQYGVIEAGDVIASHNSDGTKNPAYIDQSVPAFRAITNGRVAGLQAAYRQGTADTYKSSLISDDLHGVDPKVIEGMQNPMLVRVMPMDQVNKNTGDISNTGAGLSFNIVEQAKNDTNRLDLNKVTFTDTGDVTPQTIRDFVAAMPTTEQGNLMGKDGKPTKQAVERVDAAIFQQAYGNDKLTELAFQAQDEEARNIVRALNMAASKAIRLKDAGDYDVRSLVNEAVELAINARRNNISLNDAAAQVDLTANPLANNIIKMFADNPRSAKAIGENLSNLFDNAFAEGSKSGEDMFGAVPKRPLDQLIKESFAKETTPDLFAEAEKITRLDENAEEPPQFKSRKSPEQIAKEIEVMTEGSQVAQWLVNNAPNAAAKAISDRLLVNIKAIEDSGVPVKIEVLHGAKRRTYYGSSGLAGGGTKNIQYFKVVYNGLNAKGQAEYEIGTKEAKEGKPISTKPTGTRYSTLMHELLHVISQVQLDALIKRNFKGSEKVIYNELRSINNAVKAQIELDKKNIPRDQWHPLLKQVGRNNDRGIMLDIHELFVRSLTEKNVQSYLSTVNMGKKTALTKLMEIFRKVIGLNPDYQSALDRIMIVSEKIFVQTPKDMQRLAQTEGYNFATMKKEEQYATVDEIFKMQRDAYNELAQTKEFKDSQKLIDDARNEYIDRFNAVKAEAVRLLKTNPEFSKLAIALDEKKILESVAMDAFKDQAEKNVPLPKMSEGQRIAEQNKLIENYFKKKGIPEPREFSESANQKRKYYSDPKFKKWFGDSKVVDKNGQPLVAFHSTSKDFSEFNVGKDKANTQSKNPDYTGQLGSWFTAPSLYDREYEAGNAENAVTFSDEKEGDVMMPVHLSIKNPMEYEGFEDLRDDRDSYKSIDEYKKKLVADGYDGIVVRNSMTDGNVDRDDWVAFEPTQIKSAIGNTGKFDSKNPDIRYEETTNESSEEKPVTARNYLGKPVKPTWQFPEDTFIHVPGVTDVSINDLIYKYQDKQIDTKRAQEAILKSAGQITDDINVYEKEQLFHGKVATAIREYLLNELLPAIKKLKSLNLKPQEMQDYLLARHAEERNNKMNELNKLDPRTGEERKTPWELQDRASGMSTADARALLNGLDPAKKANLETVAKMFDAMVTGTQKILVDAGADSQDTINAWNETYKHYVPLFRIEEDFINGMGASGLSKGFNVSGNFSKRAMGSEKEVQDIITNLIKQRERALIRAEKLTVTKALYGLFLMNPNPDVALPVNPDAIKSKDALIKELKGLGYDNAVDIADNLMEEPKSRYISKEKVIDKNTGLPTADTQESVKLKVNNLDRFGDNVLTLRIDGKNRYIFFNQKNPDAVRMANSLKSLDVENLGTLTSMVSKFTRWFASVNTQYNPIFAAVNLIRDVGGAQFNLTTTPLAGKQAQVTAGIFPAMKGIFKVLRAERGGEVGGDSDMEKAFREFRKEGGQTGYRDSLARKESENSIIKEQLAKITAGGNAKKAFKAVFGALSDFNDTLENAIRLSAYLAASKPKDKGGLGLSKQQSAIIAKNLTVNFDKKGQLSANINALYAFFNASVQGTARLAQTLKGPKGKAIIGGGVFLGSMQAVLLAAAGFKDDEPPEFIKERNFIIPTPGGGFLSIPYPLGLNILPGIGRLTTEFMLTGGKNPTKKVGNLIGVFADGLSPIGSAGALQTIAPTVLDPIAALSENRDAFGRPIYKKDQATNPTPGYARSRENSSEISKQFSYFLNMASGGGKYSKGLVSPTADEIDYVVGQVTGGVGRELMKTGQTLKAASTGEDLPAYRVPLLGRFYGETESNAAESQRFYTNVTKMADYENEVKGRIKNKEPIGPYLKDNPQAKLWKSANSTENQINALNKQKKEFIERGLPKERIKRIENQKAVIMKRFNDQVAKFD